MIHLANSKKKRHSGWIAISWVCVLALSIGAQEPNVKSLKFYQDAFLKRSTEITETETAQKGKLIASYRTRIAEALSRYQNAGNLEAVQAIHAELKRIDEGTLSLESIRDNPIPQIEALQTILAKGFDPIRKRRLQDEQTLLEGYLRALETLKTDLVKENQVQEAIRVNEEIERAKVLVQKAQKDLGKERSSSEFPSALESGLVLRYTFDEDETKTVTNQAVKKWHGIISGPEKTKESKSGLAVRFTTPADRIAIEDELPDMDQMTLSVWLNNGGNQENAGIFSDYGPASGNDLYFSLISSSGVHVRADKGGSTLRALIKLDRPWQAGWNHLVWVMGRRDSKIYLNGEIAGQIDQQGSNSGHHGAFLGYAHDGSKYTVYKGIMDEVCLWRRPLTEDEVKLLYNSLP